MDNKALLTAREVYRRLGASRASFYAWLKAGHLEPIRPYKIGPRATRYSLSDVEAFEAAAADRGSRP